MVKSSTVILQGGKESETLARQAYVTLRDRIVCLDLAPGALLSETTLGASLGISRTPIREALKQLERDYLIAVMPRRGIIVTDIDLRDQLLLIDIRRGIEGTLFARAAARSAPQQRERLRALSDIMADCARRQDARGHYAADKEFDELVDICAGNRFMTDTLRPVHSLWRRFWQANSATQAYREVLDLHVAVTYAVAGGDPEAVMRATAKMFDFNEAYIRKLLG